MDVGVHLPLMPFGEEPLLFVRLRKAVDTARECGFAAVSANEARLGPPAPDGKRFASGATGAS
ncbi:MAG: hypothetical protein ACRDRD_20420 [Pseudonocardiaceae bacterium]